MEANNGNRLVGVCITYVFLGILNDLSLGYLVPVAMGTYGYVVTH